MSQAIEFSVNGRKVTLEAPGNTPLLFALRNDLYLRSTRHGCGEGDCGACTVLVDGKAVTACTISIDAIAGQDIETADALLEAGADHPLVAALLAEQAGQCGYCLAGILMRAKALMAENPNPNRDDIARALDENLCRCGAHNRIIRAIAKAAGAMRGEASA